MLRKNPVFLSLSAVVLFMVVGLAITRLLNEKPAPQNDQNPVPDVKTDNAVETSAVTFSIKHEEKKEKSVDFTADYPVIDGGFEKINGRIAKLVAFSTSSFDDSFTEDFCKGKDAPEECTNIDDNEVTVSEINNDYFSAYFSTMSYQAGAAHPSHFGLGLNYDMRTQNELKLSDFFTTSSYLAVISKLVREDLQKQLSLDAPDDMLIAGTEPAEQNFSDFVLTEKGFLFLFDDYEVAPYAAGNPRSLVSYDSVKDILKPEFLSKVPAFTPSPFLQN